MSPLRIALAGLALLIAGSGAQANGRASPTPSLYAPDWRDGAPAIAGRAAWEGGSALVAEGRRWLGRSNPTGTIGPWCADFVSFVLKRVGLPPLSGRMAADALGYGTALSGPQVGALAVMRTRRAAFGHVGFVAGVEADGSIDLLSGNYGRRVALARVPRSTFVAFVDPTGRGSARAAGESFHHGARRHAQAKLARFRHAVKRP